MSSSLLFTVALVTLTIVQGQLTATINFDGRQFDPTNQVTNFNYKLSVGNGAPIKSWFVEIPSCIDVKFTGFTFDYNEATSKSAVDINTGLTGQRLSAGGDIVGEHVFTLTFEGNLASGEVGYSIENDSDFTDGTIGGPTCQLINGMHCDAGGPYIGTCTGGTTKIQLNSQSEPANAVSYAWSAHHSQASFSTKSGRAPILTVGGKQCLNFFQIELTITSSDQEVRTCFADIEIQDLEPPTMTGLEAEDVQVECHDVPAAMSVAAKDTCDPSPKVHYHEQQLSPILESSVYVLERTWTATDSCQNTFTHTQRLDVMDHDAPIFVGVEEDIELECTSNDNIIPPPCEVIAEDACQGPLTPEFSETVVEGFCQGNKIIRRSWTVSDSAGNANQTEQIISVSDTIAPAFVAPFQNGDIEEVMCDIQDNLPEPVVQAYDQCSKDVTITKHEETIKGSCEQESQIVRTYTAQDDCGNQDSIEYTLKIVDNKAPTLYGVEADRRANCGFVPEPCTVTAIDSCAGEAKVTFTEEVLDKQCPGTYKLRHTWTASDPCGNVATETQITEVVDDAAPRFSGTPPSHLQVECDSIPHFTLTAFDDCDGDVEVQFNEEVIKGASENERTISRSWTAVDACGNEALHEQTLEVVDTILPELTGLPPALITIECDAIPAAAEPIAIDNCECSKDLEVHTIERFVAPPNPTCDYMYSVFRSWWGYDCAGNMITYDQEIRVQDKHAPILNAQPGDLIVKSHLIEEAGTLYAEDNCDADVQVIFNEERIDGDCINEYVLKRTWSAQDSCGNTVSHTQTMTVHDSDAPVLSSRPQDDQVSCDAIPEPEVVTAYDTADENVVVNYEETKVDGSCTSSYTLVRHWEATDACGNKAQHNQYLVVEDYTGPVIDSSPLQGVFFFEVESTESAPEATTLYADDNCQARIEAILTESKIETNCLSQWRIVRTWTAQDDCGNVADEVVQIVEFIDMTAPTFSGNLPLPFITVSCDALPEENYSIIATDEAFDQTYDVTFSNELIHYQCDDGYTNKRSWTAVDCAGNVATLESIMEVYDNTPPSLSNVPENLEASCDNVPAIDESVTANDTCDPTVDLRIAVSESIANRLGNNYELTRTWTVADRCQQETQLSQVITVVDTENPIFVNAPVEQLAAECDAIPPAVEVNALDNCAEVTTTLTETTNPGLCTEIGTIHRVWLAFDDNGNSAQTVQTVTTSDTTPPTFNEPLPSTSIALACHEDIPAADHVTASDNCDHAVKVNFREEEIDVINEHQFGVRRTWTAEDACGNSEEFQQIVTITDTTSPNFDSIPSPQIEAYCGAIPEPTEHHASDNCHAFNGAAQMTSEVKTDGSCAGSYSLIRTWTVEDLNGNSASVSQRVNVFDDQAPVFIDVPDAELTIARLEDLPPLPQLEAQDACEENPIQANCVSETVESACTTTFIRTCVVQDSCGNKNAFVQKVYLHDTVAPEMSGLPVLEEDSFPCDTPVAPPTVTNVETGLAVAPSTSVSYECADQFTTTYTWRAGDNCGNFNSFSQAVTQIDNVAPILTSSPALQDVVVSCRNEVPAISSYSISASDNCADSSPITFLESPEGNADSDKFKLTRRWTATDSCGNVAELSTLITIDDQILPVLAGIPDAAIFEAPHNPPSVLVTATDNCDAPGEFLEVTHTSTTTPGACPHNFTITRKWTASDSSGNTDMKTQLVTIQDTRAPVFSELPPSIQSIEFHLTPLAIPSITAFDAADGTVPVQYHEEKKDGPNAHEFTLTRTWTATDSCGNTASHTQTINVVDTTDPSISGVPADIDAPCYNVPDIQAIEAEVAGQSEPGGTLTVTTQTTAGDCANNYILTHTFTITDVAGNTANDEMIIRVTDTQNPTWTSALPQDVVVDCAIDEPADLTAEDSCEGVIAVHMSATTTENDNAHNFVVKRVFTASDSCGNAIEHEQQVDVQDISAPTFESSFDPEIEITVECDSIPEAEQPTASDNCSDNLIVTFSQTEKNHLCDEDYHLVRKWTTTDDSGHTTKVEQKIHVQDTQAPVISGAPAENAITVDCGDIPSFPVLTAVDACHTDVATSTSESDNKLEARAAGSNSYEITRTFTATDGCGHQSQWTQIITVVDDEAPEIQSGQLPFVNAPCDTIPSASLEDATATDNCDSKPSLTFTESFESGACTESFTLTRVWTATDNFGNQADFTQIVTVTDTAAPQLSNLPESVTTSCDNVPPRPPAPIANDLCDPNPTTVFSETESEGEGTNYEIIRTWTVTDACGNSASATQIVTVEDTEAPIATLRGPETLSTACDEDRVFGDFEAQDTCDANPTVTYEDTEVAGTCAENVAVTRVWTISDANSNTASYTQVMTISDQEAPKFDTIIEKAISEECDSISEAPTVDVTDNCDSNPSIEYAQEILNQDAEFQYEIHRSWTATDSCGNTRIENQVVVVQDTTKPIFTGTLPPAEITVECDDIPTFEIAAIDNCYGADSVSVTLDEKVSGFLCEDNRKITRTWTAVDGSGNEATHVQIVHIRDTTAPVMSAIPSDSERECHEIPDAPTITASDNCGTATVIFQEETYDLDHEYEEPTTIITPKSKNTDKERKGADAHNFLLVRIWTAVDECGTMSQETQTIRVSDTTEPTVEANGSNDTYECDIVPPKRTFTSSDNCDSDPDVKGTISIEDGACKGSWTDTKTWTSTDATGNLAIASQTYTFIDTTPPRLQNVPDEAEITAECDNIPKPKTVTAHDKCDPHANGFTDYVEDRVDGINDNTYTLTRTWARTDDCGNEASFLHTINVVDTTAPRLLKVPKDATVQCSSLPDINTVAIKDNCDNEATLEAIETRVNGDCANDYTLTRVWTATDVSGNQVSAQQVLTVIDDTAPLLSGVPQDQYSYAECDNIPEAPVVTAEDNCDEVTSVQFSEVQDKVNNAHDYSLIRSWTSTDVCGNARTATHEVRVRDTTAPDMTAPASFTVEYPHIPPVYDGQITAEDNCDESVEINFKETKNKGVCDHSFTIIREWTSSDINGNSQNIIQRISVFDNTPPVLHNLPTNVEVPYTDIPDPAHVTASDNSGEDIPVMYQEEKIDQISYHQYTLKRTWSAKDDCKNEAEHVQVIVVRDPNPPVFSTKIEHSEETVGCDAVPEPCKMTIDCDGDPICKLEYEESFNGNPTHTNEYIIVRRWEAVDGAGLKATQVQTLYVRDTVAPVLTNLPKNETHECGCDDAQVPVDIEAYDNCDANIDIHFSSQKIPVVEGAEASQHNYIHMRIWRACDTAGNCVQHTQNITYKDTAAPEFKYKPQTQTLSCNAVPSADENSIFGAHDNCDQHTVTVNFEETNTPGSCANSYTLTRKWTIADSSGNSNEHEQVLSVQDTTGPEYSSLASQHGQASTCIWPANDQYAIFFQASKTLFDVSDDCSEQVMLTFQSCNNTDTDPNGQAGFDNDCYYHSTSDTLYVKASVRVTQQGVAAQHYTLNAELVDQCNNKVHARQDFHVPVNKPDNDYCVPPVVNNLPVSATPTPTPPPEPTPTPEPEASSSSSTGGSSSGAGQTI